MSEIHQDSSEICTQLLLVEMEVTLNVHNMLIDMYLTQSNR